MNAMDFFLTLLATWGFMALAWWLLGVIIFAFMAKVYVHPGTPWPMRLWVLVVSAWRLPLSLLFGASGVLITLAPDGEEAEEAVKKWMAANCDCKKCRSRRGE